MTTDTNKDTRPEVKKTTFTCNHCENVKPFEEMVVVTRYFPAIVICKECEKKLR